MGQFVCGTGGHLMTVRNTDVRRVRTIALNHSERLNVFNNQIIDGARTVNRS